VSVHDRLLSAVPHILVVLLVGLANILQRWLWGLLGVLELEGVGEPIVRIVSPSSLRVAAVLNRWFKYASE
jgi:hypothetical protein